MKKIFAMLSLGLLMAGAASAQEVMPNDRKARFENREDRRGHRERKTPEEIATRQTEMLNKKLALSNKQQKKVQEISLKRAQETEALRSRYADSQEQARGRKAGVHQEMKAINDRWEADLKDILSKKQYTQYEASREEMKSRRLAARERGERERGEREGKRKEHKRQPRDNG
jgi:periplasmic protein CpxP/Spy